MRKAGEYLWIACAVAALAAFAYLNPPVRFALARSAPLFLSIALTIAAYGYGRFLAKDDSLLATALGFGIIGAIVFFGGLAHLYSLPFFMVLLVWSAAALTPLLRAWNAPPAQAKAAAEPPHSILAVTLIAAAVVSMIPFVAAPDVSSDGLQYHLLIPKLYLRANAIPHIAGLVQSDYPSLGEYLFIPLLALGGDVACKGLHFIAFLLVLAVIRRMGGLLAAALFATMPVALLTAGQPWNDMFFTLFLVLALDNLLKRNLAMAGVLFGLATWTKYTFVLVSIPFAAMLLHGLVKKHWRWPDLFRFAGVAAAVSLLWVVKNAVYTGNPFYPFANELFPSPLFDQAAFDHFRRTLTRYEIPEWRWWTWFTWPFLLTLKPRIVDVHPGVLPLLVAPLAFFSRGDDRRALLRTYVIAFIGAWLLIQTETRSMLSLLAVIAILAAPLIPRRAMVNMLIIIAVLFNAVIVLLNTRYVVKPIPYFLGRESRSQYILRELPQQRIFWWLDAQPSVRGALLVGILDPFHLRKPAIFSGCCDKPAVQRLVEQYPSHDQLATALRARGITHVVIRPSTYGRQHVKQLFSWTPRQRDVFAEFLQKHCAPLAKVGGDAVFVIR